MPRYLNPFEGRRKPIQLSGLFLFDPDVFMRLRGRSIRMTFIEAGEESLYKGLERAANVGRISKSLIDRCNKMLPSEFGRAFQAALVTRNPLKEPFAQMGPWEAFLSGLMRDDSGARIAWPKSALFVLEIERASASVQSLCNKQQYPAAAAYLANHRILQNLMSKALLDSFAKATKIEDLFPLRIAAALEVWLGILALWDIEARPEEDNDDRSYAKQLLREPAKNSVSQLFCWLLQEANAETVAELLNDARLKDFSVQVGTLGAWSRGTNFPSDSYARAIANKLFDEDRCADFKKLSAAARQLNFLGFVAQYLQNLVGTAIPEGSGLPFGHSNIETWMRTRYSVWLGLHRSGVFGTFDNSSETEGAPSA